jgi:hypothetical protein
MFSFRLLTATVVVLAIAAWPDAARARITEVVAGRSRLFAIEDNAVVVLDDGGRPLGRCARFTAPALGSSVGSMGSALAPASVRSDDLDGPGGAGIGAPDPEDILRAVGLPADDLDSSQAEAVLDNAGLEPIRRRRSSVPDPAVEVRALAADPARDDVWIATSAGLYRGEPGGCAARALAGRDLHLVAAGGNLVAAASDALLWRFDASTGSLAGVTGLSSTPHALALSRDGQTLIADEDGLLAVDPDGTATRLIDTPVDAVVSCADRNAALGQDGVYIWRAGEHPTRAADRPPARRLACGPTPSARWLAAGIGVWLAEDGTAWSDLPVWRGLSIATAAAVGGQLWVVCDGVLLAVEGPPPAGALGLRVPPPPRLPAERNLLALLPWPRVAVVFAGQRTETRSGWSAVLLLTFPLGGRPRGRSVSAERARRDAALATEEASLAHLAVGHDEDDERAARLRALRQEREALR